MPKRPNISLKKAKRDWRDDNRKSPNERGYNWTWYLRIRKSKMRRNPLCELCEWNGETRQAELVHHIVPLSEGGSNNDSNVISLCRSCHGSVHRCYDKSNR